MSTLEKRYPTLLAPLDNPGAAGRFIVSHDPPPETLIGNAYLIPQVGPDWLYLVQSNGRLQFPGGKKEPAESHREALDRELLEEAGAKIIGAGSLIGHWLVRSKSERPLRSHLPHPDSAGIVYSGSVRLVGPPSNPRGTIHTHRVRVSSLSEVVSSFRRDHREDLAELYLLASELAA